MHSNPRYPLVWGKRIKFTPVFIHTERKKRVPVYIVQRERKNSQLFRFVHSSSSSYRCKKEKKIIHNLNIEWQKRSVTIYFYFYFWCHHKIKPNHCIKANAQFVAEQTFNSDKNKETNPFFVFLYFMVVS